MKKVEADNQKTCTIKKFGNIAELAHQELRSSKTGEPYSFSAVLSDIFDFNKIFIHHQILPPGCRSSAPHFYSSQEEMIFILRGNPTVHLGNSSKMLGPGDFIGFQPGSEELHFVENTTRDEVELLVISSKGSANDTVYKANSE